MGRRKIKEPDTTAKIPPQNDTVYASPNIFKTLFGGADQNAAADYSIFADSNPFKRKPEEPKVNGNSSTDADIQKPEVDELKQRKRKIKEEEEEEGKSNIEETIEKPKKVKTQNPDLSLELKEEKTIMESDKKRKKRKRDDLEKEYEAKKYGAVVESEDNARVVVGEKRKKVDDAINVLVPEETEGFDDESKLLRTVFVGNLPLKMKKKTLIKEFSMFGEVESVRIRSVPIADTKVPRKGAIILKKFNDSADGVHAYVVFKTEQSAEASLHHNMAVVGGNHIRVDRACPPRKKLKGDDASLYDNKRTVFVGNLPFDVKDEEIYQLFFGIRDLASSIEAVRVVRDPHLGMGKGIAYIFFKTREAANLVVRKQNLKLRGRELRLTHARQDSTPSKRRNSFVGETANSLSKKLAVDSRSPGGNSGLNTKAAKSYQGLRASKSGVEKKAHAAGHSKHNGAAKMKSNTQDSQAKKPAGAERTIKRPAVALRKAKAKALKESGGSGQVAKKRKFGNRTPDSSSRNKKARKFR